MDDKYDLVGFFLSKDGLLRSGITGALEGTPLESSSGALSFGVATFALVNIVFLLLFFSQFAILWIERKAVARMQDRYGATTALRSLWVGENGVTAGEWWNMLPFGLGKPIGAVNKWLNKNFGNRDENFATVDRVNNRSWMGKTIVPGFFQNVADGMKFLVKEHMVPQRADRLIFEVSPFLIVSSTLLILGMIPLSSGIYATNPDLSILYAIAIFGIAPIGVFFAGWSSNNKYTLIGGIRSAAQLTAYEIPLLLTLLSVAILSGTFNIVESIHFQHSAGAWNIFLMPLGAALFLVTMIAEVERVPFDMPEAELVEGWWTEYGGMRFGMLFMAEYIRTYAACFLFTHFFLGGWHLPFHGTIGSLPVVGEAYLLIPGAIMTLLKSWLVFLVVFVWARFALARIRTDQILEFGWRMLLPLAVLQVVLALVYRLYLFNPDGMSAQNDVAGGMAWDAFGIPYLVPLLTTLFWLGVFWVYLNDEDKSAMSERMFHVHTVEPAGTVVPGQE